MLHLINGEEMSVYKNKFNLKQCKFLKLVLISWIVLISYSKVHVIRQALEPSMVEFKYIRIGFLPGALIYCCCVQKVDEGLPYRHASIHVYVTRLTTETEN